MIPHLRLLPYLCFIAFTLIGSAAKANVEQDALDRIANFADRMCANIPLEGGSGQQRLSGEARAELESFLKYFADIGVEGAADLQSSEYKGLIQTDIVTALSTSTNCKLQIWSDLKSKILDKPISLSNQKEESYTSWENKESEKLLISAINSIKSGNCPLSILSPYLTSLCVQHLDQMMHAFNKRGSIMDLSFLGMQDSQYGLVETYKVDFEKGVMTWFVDVGPDGKLMTFWSPTH